MLNALESDPTIKIINMSGKIYQAALRLYRERQDKEWGLTFDLEVTFKEDNLREKTINLVMRIYDYKGGPCIQFRRPKENEKDNEIKFIDDIIEREYLNVATTVINNYFYGFFEGYGDNLYDEVERIQPYIRLKYGYKNGKFFSKELPSE